MTLVPVLENFQNWRELRDPQSRLVFLQHHFSKCYIFRVLNVFGSVILLHDRFNLLYCTSSFHCIDSPHYYSTISPNPLAVNTAFNLPSLILFHHGSPVFPCLVNRHLYALSMHRPPRPSTNLRSKVLNARQQDSSNPHNSSLHPKRSPISIFQSPWLLEISDCETANDTGEIEEAGYFAGGGGVAV